MKPLPARLFLVTDRRAAREDLFTTCTEAIRGGCRWLSLREKDLSQAERRRLLERLLDCADGGDITVGAHGDVELAAEFGLGALHLPSGADPRVARMRLAPSTLIGISAHGGEELSRAAALGADYATLGPVAPSLSKPGHAPTLAATELGALAREAGIPVLALGGVTSGNIASLLEAGFAGVAVTGAVMGSADPAVATRALLAALGETTEGGQLW